MSYIQNLQHITDLANLESILENGIRGTFRNPRETDENERFVWFDYIGVYENKIFFSNIGMTTVDPENKVCLVLDFWKILSDLLMNKKELSRSKTEIIINKDLIRFEPYYWELEVWSSTNYISENQVDVKEPDREKFHNKMEQYLLEGKSREFILKHTTDSNMENVLKAYNPELVIQMRAEWNKETKDFNETYFDIRDYLKAVFCSPDDIDDVADLLRKHGYREQDIEIEPLVPFNGDDVERLGNLCHRINETNDVAIRELADELGITMTKSPGGSVEMNCIKLWQFIMMIEQLY